MRLRRLIDASASPIGKQVWLSGLISGEMCGFVGNFFITSGEGTESMLDIQKTSERGVPCLKLLGEVDRSNTEQFSAAVDDVFREGFLPEGCRRLVLDFTHLVFLDSAAVSVIFRTLSRLAPEGWLAILNPAPSILRILELVGLAEVANFRVFVSRQEMQIALD